MTDLDPNPFQDILDMIEHMTVQQSNGAPYDRAYQARFEEVTETPRWQHFYGFNSIRIPNFGMKWGGGVSFKEHLGKPLSPRLWKDLTMRIQAEWIQIYRPNDTIPCVATSYGQVNIHLDDEGNVKDIYYTPHWRK